MRLPNLSAAVAHKSVPTQGVFSFPQGIIPAGGGGGGSSCGSGQKDCRGPLNPNSVCCSSDVQCCQYNGGFGYCGTRNGCPTP